ncbi:pyridoxal phosphate-dependent decarboxylase family protein [Amnibacterium kyonggiense]|uniref:Glutamate/tyrosine decarboxylase-like PLP-dependent enzyme n=1 Tax=Amnibacterium kyonggiense TaxID=595671 RepID=A0A4R7FLB8_9MICO|nr:pyridoxal-dependent decarboxylase [Amnibacterium kyonggiense]TDS77159.1 glutamate/tyrosine decarboxylase-like PLP-dependent enzyme [Amnibacterium kyonggiense]
MSTREDEYQEVLGVAADRARAWLGTVGSRPVPPTATAEELRPVFGGPLPDGPTPASDVVAELADGAEPGLMAIGSGRFFGWVMGGTLPAALGADWLVSAWDQNTGIRFATPATAAIEEAAAVWLLDLLGLPSTAGVGFTTGATTANFSCLAAARSAVLGAAGWDVTQDGLTGAPRVHVLVGEERHETVDLALRYLGLGAPTPVAVDEEGRIRVDALAAALDAVPAGSPLIVVLQAGNVHSGAFDPFAEAIETVRRRSGWVHVDGAFGLWAAAPASMAPLVRGVTGADSWATDAHKTLSVPYDCGVAIVQDRAAMRGALGLHASYLVDDTTELGDPQERVPELSRRARGAPVWAALRSLGRLGTVELVEGLARRARAIADGARGIPGATVLNDVVFSQVCIAFEDDERTRAVTARLLADGTAWMSGSRWRGRDVIRVSVSNWSTDDEDVRRSVEALRRAAA